MPKSPTCIWQPSSPTPIHRGANFAAWQHPRSGGAQQDVAPAVQAWPHHVRDQPGNNYRSGLHPSDSPWHSSAASNTIQHPGLSRTSVYKCVPDIFLSYWGQGEETRRWSTNASPRWTVVSAVNWDFITRTNILAVVSWEVGAGGRGGIVLSIQHRGTWTKPLLSLRMTFRLLKNGNPLLPARLPFGLNAS